MHINIVCGLERFPSRLRWVIGDTLMDAIVSYAADQGMTPLVAVVTGGWVYESRVAQALRYTQSGQTNIVLWHGGSSDPVYVVIGTYHPDWVQGDTSDRMYDRLLKVCDTAGRTTWYSGESVMCDDPHDRTAQLVLVG